MRALVGVLAALVVGVALVRSAGAAEADRHERGRKIYDYRCYVCHGYAGDARTMAATSLVPPPRDFTAADPSVLTRERMITAVRDGRPGTGMTSMTRVLSAEDIELVVDYIRAEFMTGRPSVARYHTAANGWPDHDRYRAAYPFATGAVAIDVPEASLDAAGREGRALFLASCVVCHDRARTTTSGPAWAPRAVSYPRNLYDHRAPEGVDLLSGATPHAAHEVAPPTAGLGPVEREGARLFAENCAFCHAADGTGKGWIGTFLEPHPRDLTDPAWRATMTVPALRELLRKGKPGSSMPAWGGVLDDDQLDAVARYVLAPR